MGTDQDLLDQHNHSVIQSQRRNLRLAGIGLIVAFPIVGIVLTIPLAVLVDESRLEGGGALSWLGATVFYAPVVVGAVLVGWSIWGPVRPPSGSLTLPIAFLVVSAAMTLIAVWSVVNSQAGDPDIGGGILFIVGAPLTVIAVGHLRKRLTARSAESGSR